MEIFLSVVSFLLIGAGIIGSVLPIVPGPPLSFIGILVMHFFGRASFTPAFLWLWGGITVVITVGDYVLPALMTKKFGGSKLASWGSFIGLIVGMVFFPPFGMIAGTFLGAFAGEMIHDNSDTKKALKAAAGSFVAFIAGTGAKLIITIMLLYYAIAGMF